jgi:hypothetical protein
MIAAFFVAPAQNPRLNEFVRAGSWDQKFRNLFLVAPPRIELGSKV